jgi:hypothetical protein
MAEIYSYLLRSGVANLLRSVSRPGSVANGGAQLHRWEYVPWRRGCSWLQFAVVTSARLTPHPSCLPASALWPPWRSTVSGGTARTQMSAGAWRACPSLCRACRCRRPRVGRLCAGLSHDQMTSYRSQGALTGSSPPRIMCTASGAHGGAAAGCRAGYGYLRPTHVAGGAARARAEG